MESTGAGSASAENTEREDFAKVDARLDEIKDMKMGDMSREEMMNALDEKDALEKSKAEMMGSAQEEATAEGQVRENYDEAHEMNRGIDEAEQKKAEAEKVAAEAEEQAKQAEEIAIKRQAELAQADALLAEIKGGNTGANQEATAEEQGIQEQVVEPEENIMILKYGEKMRQEADQLVDIVKQIAEKQKILNTEGGAQKRPDVWEELQSLKDRRNTIRGDTSFFKFRSQRTGEESFGQYMDYKNDEVRKYKDAEKSDPYTASRLAEVAEIEKSQRGY